MSALTGKTRSILLRLPHFYGPADAGDLLAQVVDVYGRRLEQAENDLYAVLRSHHVETSRNTATRSYLGPLQQRGDLDKILSLYLEAVGGTSQLVKVSPVFTERSLDVPRLAAALVEQETALERYLRERLSRESWGVLWRNRLENARFRAGEVQPGLALQLLLGELPAARLVAERLHPDTRRLLSRYSGGPLPPALRAALLSDLNARLLPDPALPRVVRAAAAEIAASYEAPAEGVELQSLLAWVATLPTPYGQNVQRVNRRLLERLFPHHERRRPWGFVSRSFPTTEEVRTALVREFNLLLHDPALHSPERFPETPIEPLRTRYRGRLDWVNRSLLEIAFAGAVEPSHSPYRDRMRGLIAVLRRGASTRQGIVDIVAANLGIIGDDAEARRAREMIRIVEYLPRHATFFSGAVGFWESFEVRNPNATASEPEVTFTILPGPYAYLTNVRISDRETGATAQWAGVVRAGDRLMMRGTEVLVNGIPPTIPLSGRVPPLPGGSVDAPGRSQWVLDAEVLLLGNEPGEERGYPVARFDRSVGATLGTFDSTVLGRSEPIVELEVSSYHYTPGVFSVRIPWHIPGFTDKFEEQDHPRQQIRSLVHRVKAAGVQAHVTYWQLFSEAHELGDALAFGLGGRGMTDDLAPRDAFRADLRQNPVETHESESSLALEARLDYTRFDSLNTLG